MKSITLPDQFMLSPKQIAELVGKDYPTVLRWIALPAEHHLKLIASDFGTGNRRDYGISLANFCAFCERNGIAYHLKAA